MEDENFDELVSTAFTREQIDKEEHSRNESTLQKPRQDFGVPIKRETFNNSNAGSVSRSGRTT